MAVRELKFTGGCRIRHLLLTKISPNLRPIGCPIIYSQFFQTCHRWRDCIAPPQHLCIQRLCMSCDGSFYGSLTRSSIVAVYSTCLHLGLRQTKDTVPVIATTTATTTTTRYVIESSCYIAGKGITRDMFTSREMTWTLLRFAQLFCAEKLSWEVETSRTMKYSQEIFPRKQRSNTFKGTTFQFVLSMLFFQKMPRKNAPQFIKVTFSFNLQIKESYCKAKN